MKEVWQRVDPATGVTIGALDAPAAIPPGQSIALNVTVTNQQARSGDPQYISDIVLDCANTAPAPSDDLRGSFNLTTSASFEPADPTTRVVSPTTGVLVVLGAVG
jgi:hypothetical protein